jgi:cytochrome c-type biogenesis protein CcmH
MVPPPGAPLPPERPPTMAPDLDALRRQLQQLKDLHDSGTLAGDAYDTARAALEARIVEQVMNGPPAAPGAAADTADATAALPAFAAPPLPRGLRLGVAASVLALAVGGYWWKGSPELATPAGVRATAGATAASAPPVVGADQIAAMIDKLAQRLKDNPDDAEGWGMLARSYVVMGRHAEAVPAYRKALALRGDDAGLLSDAADALAVANGRSLAGEPLALVQKALQIDPTHLKALSLAGTAAFNTQDYAGAARHWERLLTAAPPDSPYLQQVRDSIDEARSLAGMPPAAAAPTGQAPLTAAPPATSTAPTAAAPGASVSGTVSLAPSLRGQANPEDTVFVFARAAEGPRMPLAIVRKQVKDLPFDFVLDDSTAMSPATKLSTQPRVIVAARITKSGNAAPQPGDLAGQSLPLALGARGLKIEISQVVGP